MWDFSRKADFRPELAWTCCDYADTLLQRNEPGGGEGRVPAGRVSGYLQRVGHAATDGAGVVQAGDFAGVERVPAVRSGIRLPYGGESACRSGVWTTRGSVELFHRYSVIETGEGSSPFHNEDSTAGLIWEHSDLQQCCTRYPNRQLAHCLAIVISSNRILHIIRMASMQVQTELPQVCVFPCGHLKLVEAALGVNPMQLGTT